MNKNLNLDLSEGVSRRTGDVWTRSEALAHHQPSSHCVFLLCYVWSQEMVLVTKSVFELWNFIASRVLIFFISFQHHKCTLKTPNCLGLSPYSFVIKKFPAESIQID